MDNTKVFGGPDPSFFRLYSVDQGSAVLRSVPTNIDRVQRYQMRVTMADLRKGFGGNEQLVGITAIPWYLCSVSLP